MHVHVGLPSATQRLGSWLRAPWGSERPPERTHSPVSFVASPHSASSITIRDEELCSQHPFSAALTWQHPSSSQYPHIQSTNFCSNLFSDVSIVVLTLCYLVICMYILSTCPSLHLNFNLDRKKTTLGLVPQNWNWEHFELSTSPTKSSMEALKHKNRHTSHFCVYKTYKKLRLLLMASCDKHGANVSCSWGCCS